MKPRHSSRFRKQNPSASFYGIRTKLKIFGNMENVLRRAIPRQVWSQAGFFQTAAGSPLESIFKSAKRHSGAFFPLKLCCFL